MNAEYSLDIASLIAGSKRRIEQVRDIMQQLEFISDDMGEGPVHAMTQTVVDMLNEAIEELDQANLLRAVAISQVRQ